MTERSMTKVEFNYHAPTSLAEAVQLLSNQSGLQPLAGGYMLVPTITSAASSCAGVVDLRKVPNLDQIATQADGHLRIGALVKLDHIATNAVIKSRWTALSDAASLVGDDQTRAHATLGGSVAVRENREPLSGSGPNDIHAALLALDARVEITSASDGESELAIADVVHVGLPKGSLITAVLIPDLGAATASAYVKMRHPASLYPICGVAAVVGVAKAQQIKSLALAVTGATAGSLRMPDLESALIGRTLPQSLPMSGVSVDQCTSDSFAASDYRQHLTGVLTQDAITSALSRIK
jgi:carbon-monoxide dehydrogenase medium subunit